MSGFSLICCVVNIGDASKILQIAGTYGVKGGTTSIGRGTVSHRLLTFLGLTELRKEIVSMVVKRESASEVIKSISKEMEFEKPHHGIAFSYYVSEFRDSGRSKDNFATACEVKKSMYKAIYVVVDKGNAEDVIAAANRAGARGGTIVNARGSGTCETQKLFSVEVEPEKEEVFILAKSDLKDGIVTTIRKDLKIDEPGNGILFVLDVNEVYGLHEN